MIYIPPLCLHCWLWPPHLLVSPSCISHPTTTRLQTQACALPPNITSSVSVSLCSNSQDFPIPEPSVEEAAMSSLPHPALSTSPMLRGISSLFLKPSWPFCNLHHGLATWCKWCLRILAHVETFRHFKLANGRSCKNLSLNFQGKVHPWVN